MPMDFSSLGTPVENPPALDFSAHGTAVDAPDFSAHGTPVDAPDFSAGGTAVEPAVPDLTDWSVPARTSEELGMRNAATRRVLGMGPVGEAKTLWQAATTPLVRLPKLAGQQVQDAWDLIGAMPNEDDTRTPQEREDEMAAPSRPPGRAAQVTAGGVNVATGAIDFMASPVGIATLGQGALPKVAQRVISGAFAADMAGNVPEQARAAGAASVDGNLQQKVEAYGGLATGIGMAGLAGAHVAAREPGKGGIEQKGAKNAKTEPPPAEDVFSEFGGDVAPEGMPGSKLAQPITATMPETAETLAVQLARVASGTRKAMLTPSAPAELPAGLKTVATPVGVFTYNPDKISEESINAAVTDNRVGEILDFGIPSKPLATDAAAVVTQRDAAGVPAADVLTTATKAGDVFDALTEASQPGDTLEVRTPGEVVAERDAGLATERRAAQRKAYVPEREDGRPWDLIDDVESSVGGKIRLGSAKELTEDFSPTGAARKLFAGDRGLGVDEVRQGIEAETGRRFESDEAFLDAITTAAEQRKTWRERQAAEKRMLERDAQATERFDRETKRQGKHRQSILPEEMGLGDQFTLRGEPVKVVRFETDNDGNVQATFVRGGERFGEQRIEAGRVLQVDRGSVKAKPVEFLTELERRLDGLKVDTSTSMHAFGLIPEAWNGAIDVAKAAVRAGRTAVEAIEAAVKWLREQGHAFDEPRIRKELTAVMEPAADQPLRQYGEKVLGSTRLDQRVIEGVSNYRYEPRRNENDLQAANRAIAERGLDNAIRDFQNPQHPMAEAVRSMLGDQIVDALASEQFLAEKTGNRIRSDELIEKQIEVINYELQRSTEVAQALQAMRRYGLMSASALLKHARKTIEGAGVEAVRKVKPAIDAATHEIGEAQRDAVRQIATDKSVNESARQAVDETVKDSLETSQAVVMEITGAWATSPTIVNTIRGQLHGKLDHLLRGKSSTAAEAKARMQGLMGDVVNRVIAIVNGHYQGAEPGKTLAEKIQDRTGLSAVESKRMAATLDKQFQSMVDAAKKKLDRKIAMARARREMKAAAQREGLNEVRQSRSVWSREKQSASETLLAAVKKSIAGVPKESETPALQAFAARLTARLREQLVPKDPAAAKAKPKLTDAQILREAVENADKYEEVWRQAQNDIRQALKPEELEKLDETLGKVAPELFSPSRVDAAIRTQLREWNLKLGEVVAKGESGTTAAKLAEQVTSGMTGKAADRLRELFAERFHAMATEAARRRLNQLSAATKVPRAVKEAHERLIELNNLGVMTDEAAYNAVREKLKLPVWSKETAAEMNRLVEGIRTKPEGFQRQRAIADMLNTIRRKAGQDWWEMPTAYWYSNVLSGPLTHAVNMVGNAQNLMAHALFYLARTAPSAWPAALASIGRGARQGGRAAADLVRTGISVDASFSKIAESGALEIARLPGNWDHVMTALRMPLRLLKAEDLIFFKTAEEFKAFQASRDIARLSGLRGDALRQHVANELGNVEARRTEAEAKAYGEGLRGMDLRRRTQELLEQGRPGAVRESARDYALRLTFNQEPYGLLGALAKAADTVNRSTGVTRALVPFTRIVANFTNEGLNYVPPFGAARGIWGHIAGKMEGKPVTDQGQLLDQWSKVAVGTLMTAGIWAALQSQVDNPDPSFWIHGAGPRDAAKRKEWESNGRKSFSVKLGNTYVPYGETILGPLFAILGNIFDGKRYNKLEETDAVNRTAYALAAIPRVMIQQGFLSSLARFVGMLGNPNVKHGATDWAKLAARTGSGAIPMAGLVRNIDALFDTTVYDSSDVESALVGSIPFVRSEGRPALNALGQPVDRFAWERFVVARGEPDRLMKLLAAKRAWPTLPNRDETIIGKRKDGPGEFRVLTDGEFYNFVKESGREIRLRLLEDLPDIWAMGYEEAQEHVRKVVAEERKAALPDF